MNIPESVSALDLRLRADMIRLAYPNDQSTARHIELAANKIEELELKLIDAELALNVWDNNHNSEYWLRHEEQK